MNYVCTYVDMLSTDASCTAHAVDHDKYCIMQIVCGGKLSQLKHFLNSQENFHGGVVRVIPF